MKLDSYTDTGVVVALDLVNRCVLDSARRPKQPISVDLLRDVLSSDPPSVRALSRDQLPGFTRLAVALEEILSLLVADDEDAAAAALNEILRHSPAHPHLAKENGRWRLHHHPATVELVSMWNSICAESIARLVGDGHTHRFGACADPRCRRMFIDTTRSATRRFCSTTCQNRIKTAVLRAGRRDGEQPVTKGDPV